MADSITTDEIREQFLQAASAMCQQGAPQYDTLLGLVADINLMVLGSNPQLHEKMINTDELARLNVECHGVIRIGTVQELAIFRWMFVTMGMCLVSYYGLSQAGVSVYSIAPRPIDDTSLTHNLFRVFALLLRLELAESEILRQKTAEILRQHDIFAPHYQQLLRGYEQQGGFNETQAQEFVQEAPETFRRYQSVTVDEETYHALHNEHRLVAGVVCFSGCHINHLTPRTLDADRVQSMMPKYGAKPKALIEGPPRRRVPILLHQTSSKALEETVLFAGQKRGTHTVRFGRTEQRGVASTPKGWQLYDDLLRGVETEQDNLAHQVYLWETFRTFPGSKFLVCQQGPGWFRYCLAPSGEAHRRAIHLGDDPQPLIEYGWVVVQPVICEDLLPANMAGIFQSNLGSETQACNHGDANRETFKQALGCPVLNEFRLYQEAKERGRCRCGLL